MKSNIPLVLFLLVLSAGCRQDAGRATAEEAPKTVEEYTQAIIREVQKVILSTNQQLQDGAPEQLSLPAETGQPARTLQLWTEAGNPVKLTATVGNGSENSSFYFANGELFFASHADANFIFIGPELKYWLDGEWKPVQRPEAERGQMQKELLEQADSYLGRFSK